MSHKRSDIGEWLLAVTGLEKQSDQPSFRPSASSKRDLSAAAALSSGTAKLRLSPKLRMDFTHVSFLGSTRRIDADSRACMPGAEAVKNGEKMADSLAVNDARSLAYLTRASASLFKPITSS